MQCISQCPGLAIFGYDTRKDILFLPVEYEVQEGCEVYLVDDQGQKIGEGVLEKVLKKPTKTNVARVKAIGVDKDTLLKVTGFIAKDNYPEPVVFKPVEDCESKTYVCHCEDVSLDVLLKAIGGRKHILRTCDHEYKQVLCTSHHRDELRSKWYPQGRFHLFQHPCYG